MQINGFNEREVKKFKLTKGAFFKWIKDHQKLVAFIGGVGLASGIFAGISAGKPSSNNHNVDNNPVASSSENVYTNILPLATDISMTTTSKYDFKIEDFDTLETLHFDANDNENTFKVNNLRVNSDNDYVFKTNINDVIVAPLEVASLIDNDFKQRTRVNSLSDISSFDYAFVSRYDDKGFDEVAVKYTSLETVGDSYGFLIDTINQRTFHTKGNSCLYRQIDRVTASVTYKNPENYSKPYIFINGQTHHLIDFIGYKNVTINGDEYMLLCGGKGDGNAYEYLVARENCILHRNLKSEDEVIYGVNIGGAGTRGNFDWSYMKDDNMYRKIVNVVLGDDGFYYVRVERIQGEDKGDNLYIFPPKCYGLIFQERTEVTFGEQQQLFFDLGIYNQDTMDTPVMANGQKLVNAGGNYFYVFDATFDMVPNETNGKKEGIATKGGIYDANSLIVGRIVGIEALQQTGYPEMTGPIDFAFSITGDSFSDGITYEGINFQYMSYKEVNILGCDFYMIAAKSTTEYNGETKYCEFIAPKNSVIIKGSEQDLSAQLSMSK